LNSKAIVRLLSPTTNVMNYQNGNAGFAPSFMQRRTSMMQPVGNKRGNEDRARRAAKCVGLQARKSRCRANSIDNHGGFQILDPMHNWVVAGERLDLSADAVIAFCADYGKRSTIK
jgi:hypothetical protein